MKDLIQSYDELQLIVQNSSLFFEFPKEDTKHEI